MSLGRPGSYPGQYYLIIMGAQLSPAWVCRVGVWFTNAPVCSFSTFHPQSLHNMLFIFRVGFECVGGRREGVAAANLNALLYDQSKESVRGRVIRWSPDLIAVSSCSWQPSEVQMPGGWQHFQILVMGMIHLNTIWVHGLHFLLELKEIQTTNASWLPLLGMIILLTKWRGS